MEDISWRNRIISRILIFSALITAGSMLLTGLVITFRSAEELKTTISQRNLQIARRASSEISLYLDDSLDQLQAVAEVLAPLHQDEMLQQLILENLVFSLDRYRSLLLVEADGTLRASSRREAPAEVIPDVSILARVLGGARFVSEVWLSVENLPYITVALPVPGPGGSRRVLVAELNLRSIWDLIDEISIGENGRAFLVTRRGILLAHPDKTWVLSSLQTAHLPGLPESLGEEGRVLVQQTAWGGERLMVYMAVQETEWIVGLTQPIREAFLPAGRILVRSLVFLLSGILLACLSSLVLARRLEEPLKALIRGTHQIGLGDLDHRIELSSRDELGQLARSFNEMLDRLSRQSQALRESEARYRLLTENVSDLIFSLDAEGRFLFVNSRAERLTGFSREHFIGRSFMDVLVPESLARGREALHALTVLGSEGADLELSWCTARDHEAIQLEIRLARFLDPGGATLYHGTARDVTEKRKLQEQLVQTEKLSSLGEIISGVAHELNNPLTSIMGFSNLVMVDLPPESAAQRDLAKVLQEADRAARIVRNLLTFARRYRPEKKPCRINEVVESVLDLRSYEMNVSSISVERRLAPDLPATQADPNQLRQVFLNLVNNAIQALQEKAGPRSLRIETALRDGKIRITFTDTGPGIPAHHLGRLFDPFFTTKPVGKGTGLGLSVSHGIIQEHGGSIRVESREGSGARFEVELPVETGGAERPDERPRALPKIGQRRLLVADDEPEILRFIGRFLEAEGCSVDLAANGEQALAFLRENDYDLIISDVRMPEKDGWDMYHWLQENRPSALRRIVYMSGDILEFRTREKIRQTGVTCLNKPFRIEELQQAIQNVLTRG